MEALLKGIIFIIVGLCIVGGSIYYFYFDRKEFLPLTFFVTVFTVLFLIIFILKPTVVFSMKIQNMDLSTAQHYHSMVVNIILGYSTVIGIGIALIWTEPGLVWRSIVSGLLAILMLYFISVMYFVFLIDLSKRIADKQQNQF